MAAYNCVSRFLVALDGEPLSLFVEFKRLIGCSWREKRHGKAKINEALCIVAVYHDLSFEYSLP